MSRTAKQEAFLNALMSEQCRGDVRKAMTEAGYSKQTRMSDVTGPLMEEIATVTKEYIANVGPKAFYAMMDVMEKPTDLGNREKLSAAKDFLDRAGFKASEKVEVKTETPLFILPPKDND